MSNIIKIGIALVGLFGVAKAVNYINKKKIFISFAMEDKGLRDLLVGQSRHGKTAFDFIDKSVRTPWDSAWKTHCREKIKSCDGVIALISKNSYQAEGARWEIKCAKEEHIPLLAIYAQSDDKGWALPPELSGVRVRKWTWKNIENFISKLN